MVDVLGDAFLLIGNFGESSDPWSLPFPICMLLGTRTYLACLILLHEAT